MSHQATTWAWNQETESSGQKLVLLAIADACGGDEDDPRICWPSVKRISKFTGLGDSTVRLHMEKLVGMGLLTKVERRVRSNGTLGTWTLAVEFQTADPSAVESADPSAVSHRRPIGALEPTSKEPSKEPSMEIGDAFGDFWAGYPRKVGKPAASKAWKKVKVAERLEVMLGLSSWVLYWKNAKTDEQFIPHPATWLNQRRWEDEIGTMPKVSTTTSGAMPGYHWSERRQTWIKDGTG